MDNREKDYFITLNNGNKVKVRDIHLEILKIMDEINRVCRKNKVDYCLIAGSAIGICNYKGFVPWDDDMDVAVHRKDWDKFVKALQKDMKKDFYFDCFETDKRYNVISGPNMKVRLRGTYIEEANILLKNRCKSGNGLFVDIIKYDSVSENKYIDEAARLVPRLLMPLIVLFDNIHIRPIPILLNYLVEKYAAWYSKKCRASSLISQTISVPWLKPFKEPIHKVKNMYPVKEYEFEGRKYFSYNNAEAVVTSWYGPNALKKWDGKKYYEPFPIEKRAPKHIKYINFNGEKKEK